MLKDLHVKNLGNKANLTHRKPITGSLEVGWEKVTWMGTREPFGMTQMFHILIEVAVWVYVVVKTHQTFTKKET